MVSLLKFAMIVFVSIIIVYVLMAVIAGNWSIMQWKFEVRQLYVFFVIILSVLILMFQD